MTSSLFSYLQIRIKVAKNPFEDYRIAVTGEGYQDDICFDQLPNNAADELRLADCPVNKPHSIAFVVRNSSASKTFRFKWPTTIAGLTFSPSIGHLPPGCSKDVTVTFCAAAPVKMQPQDVKMATVQIQYKDAAVAAAAAEGSAWDDRSTVIDYSAAPAGGKDAAAAEPVAKAEPEPAATDVSGTAKDVSLKVFAVADNPRFECDAKPILFRPTMMFQTRSYSFPLKNTSTAKMDFKFFVATADGAARDGSGLYSVTPEGGVIEPGASADITVRFAPLEVRHRRVSVLL